LQTKCEVTAGT